MHRAPRPLAPFGLIGALGRPTANRAGSSFQESHQSGPMPMFARVLLVLGLFFVLQLAAAGLTFGQESKDTAPDAPSMAADDAGREVETGELTEGDPANTGASAKAESEQAPFPVTGLVASLTIFVLAIFVGFEIITKVPPTLHTPLMSGSNAISGITIVGALLVTGSGKGWLPPALGVVALALATINVVGGFVVTHRMLAMFKRKK